MEEQLSIERVSELGNKFTIALSNVVEDYADVGVMGNILALNLSIMQFLAATAVAHEPRLNASVMMQTLKVIIDQDIKEDSISECVRRCEETMDAILQSR